MLRQFFSKACDRTNGRVVPAICGVMLLGAVSACSPVVDHRGYLPRSQDLQKIQVGMSKAEVEALLGSPSTTATINSSGDSYYYVSSIVQQKPLTGPSVEDRQVVAVRFNFDDRVQNFAHYGLEDGRIIDFITRETPTEGRDHSIIKEFFGNLGKFEPGGVK